MRSEFRSLDGMDENQDEIDREMALATGEATLARGGIVSAFQRWWHRGRKERLGSVTRMTVTSNEFSVKGDDGVVHHYNSLDEIEDPEIRAKLQAAIDDADKHRTYTYNNKVYDSIDDIPDASIRTLLHEEDAP